MRLFISLLAATVLAVVALTACNSKDQTSAATGNASSSGVANSSSVAGSSPASQTPATTQPAPGDGVRRITTVEARSALDKGEAVMVDVRSDSAYKEGHIKGAKLMPSTEFLNHIGELPRDKMIITYCSWPNEHTSAGAVLNLKVKGIENAAALLGGYDAWVKAGYPVESAPK